jgi:hypothetical protein
MKEMTLIYSCRPTQGHVDTVAFLLPSMSSDDAERVGVIGQ